MSLLALLCHGDQLVQQEGPVLGLPLPELMHIKGPGQNKVSLKVHPHV